MNADLIKRLYEQANVHDYTTWDAYNQKELVYHKFDREKFAELIVKECVNAIQAQASDEDVLDSWDRGFMSGLATSVEVLEAHFGVE